MIGECPVNSNCQSSPEGAFCQCFSGFIDSNDQSDPSNPDCIDIDECGMKIQIRTLRALESFGNFN